MILITGGAGYIGSHMCVALAQAGQPYLVLDNFSNSQPSVLERMGQIIGQQPQCIEGDVRDAALLADIFARFPIEGVIHFAALKAVGESVAQPLRYYENNVAGTVTLLQAMQAAQVTAGILPGAALDQTQAAALQQAQRGLYYEADGITLRDGLWDEDAAAAQMRHERRVERRLRVDVERQHARTADGGTGGLGHPRAPATARA